MLKQKSISYNLNYGVSYRPLIDIGKIVLDDNIFKYSAALYCLGADTMATNSYLCGLPEEESFERLIKKQFHEFFIAHEAWGLQNADLSVMLDKNLSRDDYVAQISVPILAKMVGREEVIPSWTDKVRTWDSRVDEYEEMLRRLETINFH